MLEDQGQLLYIGKQPPSKATGKQFDPLHSGSVHK